MRSIDELKFDLKIVDNLAGSIFENEKIEFYFAGGVACILSGQIDRMTRDFDFIDIGYPAKYAKILKLLEPYDILTTFFSAIPVNYKERAKEIAGFKHISVYILSNEDIIASKIDRLSEKDIEDINILIKNINREILIKSINETIKNIDFKDKREKYKKNIKEFEKIYQMRILNV